MEHIVAYSWYGGRAPKGTAQHGVARVQADRAWAGPYGVRQRAALYQKDYPGKGPVDAAEKFLQIHSDEPMPAARILTVFSILPTGGVSMSFPANYRFGGCEVLLNRSIFEQRDRHPDVEKRTFSVVGTLKRREPKVLLLQSKAKSVEQALELPINITDLTIWCVVERQGTGVATVYVPSRGAPEPHLAVDPGEIRHWKNGEYSIAWEI